MVFARPETETRSAYSDFEPDPDPYEDEPHWEINPSDRLGPRLPSRRGRRLLQGALLLGMLGGGAALHQEPTLWPWLSANVTAFAAPLLERAAAAFTSPPPAMTAAAVPTATAPAPTPAVEAPIAPLPPPVVLKAQPDESKAQQPPMALLTTAALPDAGSAAGKAASVPYAPPAQTTDPLQARAVAAGLHPDLSRVLLAQLSETDYRNAGVAIRTALAETADTAVHTWPRQRTAGLALFEVRFVPGAATDCRRYVVTIAKQGWLTTALPMEKCGLRPRQPGATAATAPTQPAPGRRVSTQR